MGSVAAAAVMSSWLIPNECRTCWQHSMVGNADSSSAGRWHGLVRASLLRG